MISSHEISAAYEEIRAKHTEISPGIYIQPTVGMTRNTYVAPLGNRYVLHIAAKALGKIEDVRAEIERGLSSLASIVNQNNSSA